MTTLFSRHLTQARRDERVREAARELASTTHDAAAWRALSALAAALGEDGR